MALSCPYGTEFNVVLHFTKYTYIIPLLHTYINTHAYANASNKILHEINFKISQFIILKK